MTIPALLRRRWVKHGLEALLFLVLFLAVATWQTRHMARGPAPELAGITLDGAAFDLGARGAGPMVVHFWATWCPICKAEEGTIAGLAADPQRRVITVAMEPDEATVRAHLREQAVQMPVLLDRDGALAERWGVRGVPATFVIDERGTIRFREMGYTTGAGLRLRLWWAGLTS